MMSLENVDALCRVLLAWADGDSQALDSASSLLHLSH